jgi:hypothetical protein
MKPSAYICKLDADLAAGRREPVVLAQLSHRQLIQLNAARAERERRQAPGKSRE